MTNRVLRRRTLDIWGTTITIDAVAESTNEHVEAVDALLDEAFPEAERVAQRIDTVFSTWRADSLATALRNGDITVSSLADMGAVGQEMLHVITQCEKIRELTRGAFDPWVSPEGFDPSGYVKGWGASKIADVFTNAGLQHVCVNAAGDIATRGYGLHGKPWRVGITHPDNRNVLCATVETTFEADIEGLIGAVATSGFSEQQEHVHGRGDSGSGIRARQATVVGPDAGIADALATALLIDGRQAASWFTDFAQKDVRLGRLHSRWGALIIEENTVIRLGRVALGYEVEN